jgi:hypothetical protein
MSKFKDMSCVLDVNDEEIFEKLAKHHWSVIGWVTNNYLEPLRAMAGTLSRWSWLYLQSLAPTNQSAMGLTSRVIARSPCG